MGKITDDMTRLCGDIETLRGARGALMEDLARGVKGLKHSVIAMRVDFSDAHAKMAKHTNAARAGFVSGMKKKVARMRKEFTSDLAGAHRAWYGSTKAEIKAEGRRMEEEALEGTQGESPNEKKQINFSVKTRRQKG